MNKIKRELVEELYQAELLYKQERAIDNESEECDKAWKRYWKALTEVDVETDRDERYKAMQTRFVIDVTKASVNGEKSISRLIKTLDVNGIEVVE